MTQWFDGKGRENRTYPGNCQSMFCGRGDCTGCKWLPEKQAFDTWREKTNALREDPIWCPTIWTAQQGE